jgi:YggT family protein
MVEGLGYWLYFIPNFALAALMYTIAGRFMLSLVFKPDSDKVIWRVFAQTTDWFLRFVRSLTPAMVPDGLMVLFSIFWVVLFRILLLIVAVILGLSPISGGQHG